MPHTISPVRVWNFHHFVCAWLGFGACLIRAFAQDQAGASPVLLTNAAQVRALASEDASKRHPVRLRGVVLSQGRPGFILADETAGVYVEGPTNLVSGPNRGDLIELEGWSNPGSFAPYVDAVSARTMGVGKIPEPKMPDADELFSGRLDAQWIEITGVVRRLEAARDGLQFELQLEKIGGRILAHAHTAPGDAAMAGIVVDAVVRLRGVCFYQFTKGRQALTPYVSVPIGEPILVREPAMTNLGALPVRSVESLMQFSATEKYEHRVRVRGALVYAWPGDGFWIHDGRNGLRVSCDARNVPGLGTEVDVCGFLKRGESGPLIEDAVLWATGNSNRVDPVRLRSAGLARDHDSDVVECEAVIQQVWVALDGCRLRLLEGTNEFSAVLHSTNGGGIPRWLPGSRVRVTGLCVVSAPGVPLRPGLIEPESFQILLRSPSDVVIIEHPPWWTVERVGWLAAGVMGVLLAVGGGFFWAHRRRVRRQVAAMKTQAALEAERARIACDLHDEIGANLTHISILSTLASQSAAENPRDARQHCAEAAQVSQQTIRAFDEILWSVNPRNDTIHSLSHYICRHAEETLAPAGIAHHFDLDESFPDRMLPPHCRHGLLLAVKEVLHNVIKHASASRVEIKCGMEDDRQYRVRVSDDGRGIDSRAATAGPARREGLGLESLRRRMAELGGTCVIESPPAGGTVVTLRLPL
jgi:signal transduction histidine kinase